MRASQLLIATVKETPADAEVISHQLLLRAGFIRKLAAGMYNWLPLGLRTLRKVEAIVREEMDRSGAQEVLMPVVQPLELWEETGRAVQYGPELCRLQDRHERAFCLGPTHEEVITDLARNELRSYRQLPVNFYQIQTKFRDEIRPRFGLMRGREFIMKDAYSFHISQESLQQTYDVMYDTYSRIFTRLGLDFRAVIADTGSIGGSGSHEFHVLADSGEDDIAFSDSSDYAANVEMAEALPPATSRATASMAMQEVATPTQTRCEDVAAHLGIDIKNTVKAVAVINEGETAQQNRFFLLLVRGDHELNEIKAGKLDGLKQMRLATEAEIVAHLNCKPGFIGPVGVKDSVTVIADRSVAVMSDFVCGANREGFHLHGVNFGRDLPEPALIADIRNVVEGDPSPDGNGAIRIRRGIEVGHIFQLGTKYSAAMKATVLNEEGREQVMVMGCYGIGVSRVVAAAIEQNYDDKGIIWPDAIAPFRIAIVSLMPQKSAEVRDTAEKLYAELTALGYDVLLDDRDERPGVKFADMELIGIPHRIVIGDRALKEGNVEYKGRRDSEAQNIAVTDIVKFLQQKLV